MPIIEAVTELLFRRLRRLWQLQMAEEREAAAGLRERELRGEGETAERRAPDAGRGDAAAAVGGGGRRKREGRAGEMREAL